MVNSHCQLDGRILYISYSPCYLCYRYDDRFLVKPTKSAMAMMPDADREIPYEGAKEMLLVDNVDSREFLTELLTAMYDELPEPKEKR